MRSKILYTLVLATFLTISCTEKTESIHQTRTPENQQPRQNTVDAQGTLTSQLQSISNRITSGDYEEMLAALREVGTQLAEIESLHPTTFMQRNDYHLWDQMRLDVFVSMRDRETQADENTEALEELLSNYALNFNNTYTEPCLTDNDCDALAYFLERHQKYRYIVMELYDDDSSFERRLRILGLSFDARTLAQDRFGGSAARVMIGSRSGSLQKTYFELLLELFTTNQYLDLDRRLEYRNDFITLTQSIDWSNVTLENSQLFSRMRPWTVLQTDEDRAAQNSVLAEVAQRILPYIPLYLPTSVVSQDVQTAVRDFITNSLEGQNDLRQYYAYDDIQLNAKLESRSLLARFIALSVYFGRINLDKANELFRNVQNKDFVFAEVSSLLQELVRWDIAQLSIQSTELFSELFIGENAQEAKTTAFVQQVFDDARQIVPEWSQLHSTRVWAARNFIDAHKNTVSIFDNDQHSEFYDSIDRNILKSVVYPNMLAYSYFLSKTEWSAKIRFWFFEFTITTNTLLIDFFTGRSFFPWFDLTNPSNKVNNFRRANSKSLFRSDIHDVMFYFFANRIYEAYDINPDDFLKEILVTLTKRRENNFRDAIVMQQSVYLEPSSPARRVVDWCNGIRANSPVQETISFYSLHEKTTAVSPLLAEENRMSASLRPFYYGDKYSGVRSSVLELNDIYRLEFLPMVHAAKMALAAAESIQSDAFEIGDLPESRQFITDLENLGKTYLGLQMRISGIVDDCNITAYNEATRRSRELGFAQKKYYEEIIHPLAQRIFSDEINGIEATQLIVAMHDHPEGMQGERLTYDPQTNTIYYELSVLPYMLRTAQLMTTGLSHYSVNIEPVVGPHLTVSIPEDYLTDTFVGRDSGNPFLPKTVDRSARMIPIHPETTAEEFAQEVTYQTTDRIRTIAVAVDSFFAGKYTSWDQLENAYYLEYLTHQMQFYAQLSQLSGAEYIDLTDPSCESALYGQSVNEDDCIETLDFGPRNAAHYINRMFETTILDEQEASYLDLVAVDTFAYIHSMSVTYRLDVNGAFNYTTGALPYTELNGFFDMLYTQVNSDFLGDGYSNEWNTWLNSRNPDRFGSDSTCAALRNGCQWQNEREYAKDLFSSRWQRPGFIFKMDHGLLTKDYQFISVRLKKKYDVLFDIQDNGQEYLANVRPDWEEPVLFDLNKAPMALYPIRNQYLNTETIYNRFFREETQGKFIPEDHDWSDFILYR